MKSSKRRNVSGVAKKQPGFIHKPGQGTGGVRRVVAKVPGRPGVGLTQFKFPVVGYTPTLRPVFKRLTNVRIMHKVDPAKGITSPEAGRITQTHGVDTGRGFLSRAVEVSKATMAPSGRGSRVLKTPSPTGGAGVRSPFNAKSRVGRGSGRRTGGKRFGG